VNGVGKDTALAVARDTLAAADETTRRADAGGPPVDWAFRAGALYAALRQLVAATGEQGGAA